MSDPSTLDDPPHATRGPLRIALVGPSRFGLGEPYAGGLEAHTATLARQLHRSGHDVTVFAGPANAPHGLPVPVHAVTDRSPIDVDRLDTSNPPWFARHEDESYSRIADILVGSNCFDVVHNNSLHRRIVDLDEPVVPIMHVLHCPPFDVLEQAHQELSRRRADRTVVAVSGALADAWADTATAVVHNGVDLHRWRPRTSQQSRRSRLCVWAGRIIEEKGPHHAIDAALSAGHCIALAGPVHDRAYFESVIEPRLATGQARWLGPLDTAALRRLFDTAAVGVITPMWDEPFGLVAAEMLACGVPIAAFDNGAIAEFTHPSVAVLVDPGNDDALAAAICAAGRVDRSRCREWAVHNLSLSTMSESYVALYRSAILRRARVDDAVG